MPRKPAKPCTYPGCGALTHGARCSAHKVKPWAGSTRRQRLPKDWPQRVRLVRRRAEERCEYWGASGRCQNAADEVDHIVNNDDHSLANLQALCLPHHRLKTSQEAARGRRRGKR